MKCNFAFGDDFAKTCLCATDRIADGITPVSEWPNWLEIRGFAPHAILLGVSTWIWWPTTNKE
jgi:hypothetical protein